MTKKIIKFKVKIVSQVEKGQVAEYECVDI